MASGQGGAEADGRGWYEPRLGLFTVEEAAVCAEAMRTLARYFAQDPGNFPEVSFCMRVAIWLDRAVAQVDTHTMLTDETTAIPMPAEFIGKSDLLANIALSIRNHGPRPAYDFLYEACLRLIVAIGAKRYAEHALLDFANAALRYHEDYPDRSSRYSEASACYEQLIDHPDVDFRASALYGDALAHLMYGQHRLGPHALRIDVEEVRYEYVLANERVESLQLLFQSDRKPSILDIHERHEVTQETVTQLLTTITQEVASLANRGGHNEMQVL